MNGFEATRVFIHALESAGVYYMVAGSLSSNAFGSPRSTKDADVVVVLKPGQLDAVMAMVGSAFELDPQASFEAVTGTYRHIIQVVSIAFKIELFLLSRDEHDQMRFQRKKRVRSGQVGCDLWLPTPEDIIVMKLRWAKGAARSKDTDDARNIIAVQGDALDWPYIHGWCEKHGTGALLDEIRASIPSLD